VATASITNDQKSRVFRALSENNKTDAAKKLIATVKTTWKIKKWSDVKTSVK
jgi:hypothetical protein